MLNAQPKSVGFQFWLLFLNFQECIPMYRLTTSIKGVSYLGGISGGIVPVKILKIRTLQMRFPAICVSILDCQIVFKYSESSFFLSYNFLMLGVKFR